MNRSSEDASAGSLGTVKVGRRREPLDEGAVFVEVRRRARRRGILLRKTRTGSQRRRDFGTYYAVNAETGFVEASRVSLADAAIDLGVMNPGDTIALGGGKP